MRLIKNNKTSDQNRVTAETLINKDQQVKKKLYFDQYTKIKMSPIAKITDQLHHLILAIKLWQK